MTHFILFGAAEQRNPNPLFDSSFYVANYPDVAESGNNPLVHYIESGAAEARDPHPEFVTAYYLTTYPDVAESGLNPLAHYLTIGRGQGRHGRPPTMRRDAVLMIDALYPRPNEDSGSLDQISFIKIFRSLGYRVYFASAVEFGASPILAHPVEESGAICIRFSDYSSIDEFVQKRAGELAVCFLSRVHAGAHLCML